MKTIKEKKMSKQDTIRYALRTSENPDKAPLKELVEIAREYARQNEMNDEFIDKIGEADAALCRSEVRRRSADHTATREVVEEWEKSILERPNRGRRPRASIPMNNGKNGVNTNGTTTHRNQSVVPNVTTTLSLDKLKRAKQFADEFGGIDSACELLVALKQLLS